LPADVKMLQVFAAAQVLLIPLRFNRPIWSPDDPG
jgi:hypothetical protein